MENKMTDWLKKDLHYIWHPYTQMKDCRKWPPILIEKAKGVKLYDDKGNFYYDTISSWWCNVHGHNHPKIKAAIREQLNSLDHILLAGFTHKSAVLLAEKLVSITPKNLTKVFFSDNGSTAVETALKMSFQYWRNIGRKSKTKFLSLDLAYHGDTVGAMSVSGDTIFSRAFDALHFKSFNVPTPYCYRCPFGKQRESCSIDCIKPLQNILKKHKDKIAAVILEPLLLAAGGMIVYPVEYLKRAASLAKKYNVHLILDEVAVGFGRTGKMFACEHASVRPDFLCLAKGITSGTLPFAATLTTDKIYNAFYDDYEKFKTFYHGHTYTANPIGCAVALATLEIFKQEKTIEKVQKLVPIFHKGMEKFRALPFVGDVRYVGLVGAIELVKDKKTKKPFEVKERIGQQIFQKGLREHLILRPLGNVIYLFLPLCITIPQLNYILKGAFKVIKSCATQP
ncbi:MAG: adenosylmethionine--8-amino-7-oxononanoate transaminase [Sedimentisphaerales bacterium]|nr:adenosylmethionine--8-amino-7-oxononanoate transaminase [Sedimentisphaerales bacterium]